VPPPKNFCLLDLLGRIRSGPLSPTTSLINKSGDPPFAPNPKSWENKCYPGHSPPIVLPGYKMFHPGRIRLKTRFSWALGPILCLSPPLYGNPLSWDGNLSPKSTHTPLRCPLRFCPKAILIREIVAPFHRERFYRADPCLLAEASCLPKLFRW